MPPENWAAAEVDRAVGEPDEEEADKQPENWAPAKSTIPPENRAPSKSPPSKTTPVKSRFKPSQDTAASLLRCAVMTRMTVWRTSRMAWKASCCGSGAS